MIFLVDKICEYLTKKIKNKIPEINEEKAEVINYGLHLLIGEIPKNFILLFIAYILGVFEPTLMAVLILIPYRGMSGGFHLKTHIGCMIATGVVYIGNAYLSRIIIWNSVGMKYFVVILIGIFSGLMIKKYAPADTEYIPILRKKDRVKKKKLSYITMLITLVIGLVIKSRVISNICIIGVLIQTISITKIAYKVSKCKYGYEVNRA